MDLTRNWQTEEIKEMGWRLDEINCKSRAENSIDENHHLVGSMLHLIDRWKDTEQALLLHIDIWVRVPFVAYIILIIIITTIIIRRSMSSDYVWVYTHGQSFANEVRKNQFRTCLLFVCVVLLLCDCWRSDRWSLLMKRNRCLIELDDDLSCTDQDLITTTWKWKSIGENLKWNELKWAPFSFALLYFSFDVHYTLYRSSSREQQLSLCAHIALASSNVSRRIRIEPVHTVNLLLFQSIFDIFVSRKKGWREEEEEKKWTIGSNIIDANEIHSILFLLLRIRCNWVIVGSSILSFTRNDLRLIKHESTRVQCVNLIHSRPLGSILSFFSFSRSLTRYIPIN